MESRIREMAKRVCLTYIAEIGMCGPSSQRFSAPSIRYILSFPSALPLKYVMISERPYASNIHGHVFSALSYDKRKSPPTPSTIGVSYDVANTVG
jgi:hypothetical protein